MELENHLHMKNSRGTNHEGKGNVSDLENVPCETSYGKKRQKVFFRRETGNDSVMKTDIDDDPRATTTSVADRS